MKKTPRRQGQGATVWRWIVQDDHNAISPEEEWQKLTGAAARLDAWIKSAKAEKPEDREKLDIIGAGFQCIKEGLLNGQAMVQELTGEADTRRSQKKLVQAILAVRDAADPELAPAAQGADRSMLMQYVDAGFTLYAKKEFQGEPVDLATKNHMAKIRKRLNKAEP